MKQHKQGFSLVEVLIIMTVAAVLMAAAVPVLSRKSHPIPRKLPHGVYRCIGTPGGLIEEYYSKNRLVSQNRVESCRFAVPQEVSKYKIDLYGAGAGGTKYASYTTVSNSDHRELEFGLQQVSDYVNGRGNIRDVLVSRGNSLSYIPSNEDFVRLWDGITLRRANVIGKARDGGTASLTYANPALRAYCPCIHEGGGIVGYVSAPEQYNGQSNISFDIPRINHLFSAVRRQYNNCPCADLLSPNTSRIQKTGKSGGLGRFLMLDFQLDYNGAQNSIAKRGDYPFLRYVESVTNINKDTAFAQMRCKRDISEHDASSLRNCEVGVSNPMDDAEVTRDSIADLNTIENYRRNTNRFTFYGVNDERSIALVANDGEDTDSYAGFRAYINGRQTVQTNQTAIATGGTGGAILIYQQVNECPEGDDTAGVDCSWRVQTADKAQKTDNLDEFRPGPGWVGTNAQVGPDLVNNDYSFRIYGSDHGYLQNPFITMQSDLWQKTYEIGQHGGQGGSLHTEAKSMGTSCTISLSSGGPILDVADLKNRNINQSRWIQETQDSLKTSISCTDRNGNVVYADSIPGGLYEENYITPPNSGFTWTRQNNSDQAAAHLVTAPAPDRLQNNMGVSSPFSRIFLRGKVETLASLNISAGGAGTSLEDRCTFSKGNYSLMPFIKRWQYYDDSTSNSHLVGDEFIDSMLYLMNQNSPNTQSFPAKAISSSNNGMADNGLDCYQDDFGQSQNPGTRELGLRTNAIPDLRPENAMYTINAGAGGGGAVVISW